MGDLMYANMMDAPSLPKGKNLLSYMFGVWCRYQAYSRPVYSCGLGHRCRRKARCPRSRSCFISREEE